MAGKTKTPGSRRAAAAKGAVSMADATAGLLLREFRASIARMPATGKRLARNLWRTAQTWVGWIREQADSALSLAEATRFSTNLRQRGEWVLGDLDVRRVQILARLERQATGLVEVVLKRLPVARRDEIAGLQQRLTGLERRLAALDRGRAA
jgi:polyhydroxyalkanoate synthesis regulator phasin